MATAQISLAPFLAGPEGRKEFIAHFHSEGLSDTYIKVRAL